MEKHKGGDDGDGNRVGNDQGARPTSEEDEDNRYGQKGSHDRFVLEVLDRLPDEGGLVRDDFNGDPFRKFLLNLGQCLQDVIDRGNGVASDLFQDVDDDPPRPVDMDLGDGILESIYHSPDVPDACGNPVMLLNDNIF